MSRRAKTAVTGVISIVGVLWTAIGWLGDLQTIQEMLVLAGWLSPAEKPMTAPAIFLTWWFPFVSVLAAVLLILLLWRRELAPLFTREHLLPTWRFWDQILPQFIFARRRELHARRRIHTLVEWGREIRDKTTWDPAEERAEWFRSAYETIQESYPLKAPGFFAVHGDRWNTKGHREILNDEIQWLINILNS